MSGQPAGFRPLQIFPRPAGKIKTNYDKISSLKECQTDFDSMTQPAEADFNSFERNLEERKVATLTGFEPVYPP